MRDIRITMPDDLVDFLSIAIPSESSISKQVLEVLRRYRHLSTTKLDSASDSDQMLGVVKYWRGQTCTTQSEEVD